MGYTVSDLDEAIKKRKKNQDKVYTVEDLDNVIKYRRTDTSNVNQAYIDSFINDAKTFLTTAEKDYGGIGWANASSSYDSTNTSWQDLNTRADTIDAWLYQNKKNLDSETYKSLSDSIGSIRSSASSVLDSFKGVRDYYSQWETEDDYNSWYEHMKNLEADDFEEYSQKGASIENPTYAQANGSDNFLGWKNPFKEGAEINNIVTFSRDNIDDIEKAIAGSNSNADLGSVLGDRRYKFLTDDEVSVYNYYLGKGDNAKAEEYLKYLDDTLNKRWAGDIAEGIDDNVFLEALLGFNAGLETSIQGFKGLADFFTGNDYGTNYSATQYADQLVASNNQGFIKGFHDVSSAIGGMTPSILVGSLTGGLGGALTMGASATGNAYNEMIDLGYNQWQARGYGLLVGASEAALSYAIGGISKLGGKLSNHAINNLVSKVDNAIARTAIQLGGNMVSEGVEEAIQTVLEPAFKALMTGETFEAPEWEDVWYSALLGALTAGVLEGVPTIAGTAISSHQANKVYGADASALVGESLEIDPDNAHAQRMQARLDNNKNVSGYQLNRLVNANEETLLKQDTAKMKSAVESRLTELGETGDISKLADIIVKAQSGEKLTRSERSVLVNSKYGRRVSTELNPKSIESGEYSSAWAENIGTERINTDAYNKGLYDLAVEKTSATGDEESTTVAEESNSVTENPTAKENATEAKFEASTDGKTRIGDLEVSIKEIASVKNGEVTLRLEDDSTVSARDVEYGSSAEALLYENVADMNLNAATANAFVRGYDPSTGMSVEQYALGFREAYRYGEYNFPVNEMSSKGFSDMLSESQRNLAYNLGKTDAKYKIDAKSTKIAEKIASTSAKNVGKDSQKASKKGKLHNTIAPSTERQKASLKALGVLAKTLGIDIYTFESQVDAEGNRYYVMPNGKKTGANGWYDPSDNSIHIDLNAGFNGEGTMLFTAAHELTHFIREWSPAKFKVFADFILENYGKKGISVDALVNAQIEKARKKGRVIDYDTAYEEVIADSCEAMLADGDAISKIAELKAKDKTLWQKIRDYLTNLVARIKDAYKGMKPDSYEGRKVAEMLDTAEKLKALWTEALVDASDAYNQSDIVKKDLANKDLLYNLRATESHKNKLSEQYTKDASVSLEELTKRYDKIIGIWKRLGGELNSKFLNEWNNKVGKDRAFTVFKAQAGYKYNVELSSMCKKGVPLFEAIDTIVKKEVMKELDSKVIGKAEKEILYDILKDHHFEIPCAICYVEQARQREGVIIDAFLNGKVEKDSKGKITTFKLGWNEVLHDIEKEMKANGVDYTFKAVDRSIATDQYAPQDLTMDSATQEAFYNALKKIANKEISRYNKADGKNRKLVTSVTPSSIKEVFKGTLPSNLKIFKVLFTDPTSRFTMESDLLYSSMTTHNLATSHNALYGLFNSQGGVSGYKTKQGTVVYWGDILGKKWSPAKVRDEGGIRNQSNSDFQMYTLLDQAQMYIDFTAKGYYLQAYTKVLSELKLFGLSRGKINASLIPAVYEYLNADGSVDVETTRLYAGLDKNGNLLFDDIEGINHAEAFMLLEDAEYSKSIGGICIGYSDNHILKLLDDSRVQQIIGFHDKTDDPDKRYRGAKYAKNYNGLNEAINKDGKTVHIGFNPYVRKAEKMFTFNSKTETYEGEIEYNGKTYVADDIPKLAADLYLEMCDKKGYTPAYADFDFHENYYKLLADFSLYDSHGHYAPHRKVAYNMPDQVPYLDLNGKKQYMDTDKYIKSELKKELKVRDSIGEALADTSENGIIPQFKKKVNELHKDEAKLSDRDSSYMDAVNRGDMETAQKMVDEVAKEAGYTIKGNHGTLSYFTIFDRSFGNPEGDWGKGFYFTNNQEDVETNYASADGADLQVKIEKYAQQLGWTEEYGDLDFDELIEVARKELTKGKPRVIKAYLKMDNPVVVGGQNETYFDYTEDYNEETDEYGEPTGKLVEFVEALSSILEEYEANGAIDADNVNVYELFQDGDGYTASQLEKAASNLLENVMDENGDYASKEIIRAAFEEMGFDGIVDSTVAGKFGDRSGRRNGGMAGVTLDTTHYIAFKSSQIKQSDPVVHDDNGNVIPLSQRFNPKNNDIRYSDRYSEGLSEADVEKSFEAVWDAIVESTDGKYKNVKDFLRNHTDYEQVDYWGGMFDVVDEDILEELPVTKVDGLWNDGSDNWEEKWTLGEVLEAYQNGTLDKFKFRPKVEPAPEKAPTTWKEEAETLYTEIYNEVSDHLKQNMPSFEDLLSIEWGSLDSEQPMRDITFRVIQKEQDRKLRDTLEKKAWAMKDLLNHHVVVVDFLNRYTNRQDLLYSDRSTDSFSNRSLLANALESVAKNDIERKKLEEYKGKIALIESEQAKLAEVKKKANDIRFTKGRTADETKRMKDLEFEANQIANRINTYDKQLLDLESTKALKGVLEREKQMAYKRAKQRGKEALEAYRERATKTQRELMDRYQESRKKGVESRNMTAMRHKIKDVVKELNDYLLKGTKDKHVPIQLQKAVAEALDAVNMDTVGAEERIAKKRAEMMRAKSPEVIEKLVKEIEHIQEMGGNMEAKLSRLKTSYDSIINSDDPLVANSHDDVISNTIDKVIEVVGDTPLRDMSLYQLEAVYDMYRMILHSIRSANKAFKAAKGEEISTIANGVIAELVAMKRKSPYRTKAMQTISEFDWNNLKPVYAFERIGSANFTKVFNAVRAGEDVWARDMSEASAFREEQSKKYKYDSFDFEKKYAFETNRGDPFELTLGEMMSIYAYAKDEHSKGHLVGEGFVFDPKKEVVKNIKGKIEIKVKLEDATSYNLSEEVVEKITQTLSEIPGAKDFVDVMQDYLSTTMGEKGNEVSLELYQVKLFKNKNYFPLKSAPQYMAVAKEQAKGDVKIKNKGFTKDRKEGAKNPIVLSSFMDVWASHVNEMSMYHAFTLPLEDFYRVFNYRTPNMEGYAPMSVNASLEDAYGTAATSYIEQLLKDINGGARVDPTAGVINKLTGLFKKSAVFGSLSVVVQQPSAIARATALVDSKYFVGKSSGKHKEVWAEVKKYAPVAVIKEMGYFDTGMGQSSVEWLKGEKTWKDKVDDALSKAPALADEYAWCAIWNAVKRETLNTYKHLVPNSDAFLKVVGERFTEVITKTQVYDSVLSRSANMRSKDTGMKMATAFMGEPTTSINMLQDALTQGKRGNKRYARKAVGGVVASMILNSILVSLVYAGRDDDEEKTYAEKYVGTLTEELIDSVNPLTLIPFVKDVVSIVQGYDVERSDMAVITDVINAWNNLDSDNRSAYRKVEDFAGALASIFGLPVKNIMRDARGMYNTVNSFINGEKTTGAGIGSAVKEAVTGKEESNGQQLYEAMLSGDATQIERVKGRFKDQKAIDSAIRTALRDNDPRIKEAAEARYNGDIAGYMRIAKEIIAEGHFKQDDIVSAINSEITALKKGEGTTSASTSSNKVESIYEVADYYSALEGRDQATAYAVKEDIIKVSIANGKDRDEAEADFNSKFASHLRDVYEVGGITDYEARNMLINYGGKSEEQAYSKVQYWAFKKKYPDYDLTEDAVTKYYNDVEHSGISIDVYYDYTLRKSKCKGVDANGDGKTDSGSVKSEVMAIINSLPISNYQKDVLYYLNGWSASTIWQAPWH